MKVKCKICGTVVRKRRNIIPRGNPDRERMDTGWSFPSEHINPETKDTCHGFFVEAFDITD